MIPLINRSVIVASLVVSGAIAHAQSGPNSASTSPTGRYVAIGCLTKQGSGNTTRYLVTDTRGNTPTIYRLQGDAAQLERHVGHTVEATGSLNTPSAGTTQYTLRVTDVVWLATGCKK
ncbi:MAG: hypothetical protein QM736_07325 [Vicinamibacterales bacterium]